MPAKKKTGVGTTSNPVPFGMSNKMMKRKKPINLDFIKKVEPITPNQETFFDKYKEEQNLVAYGCAGTCLLYTSPSPRDRIASRMPSSA